MRARLDHGSGPRSNTGAGVGAQRLPRRASPSLPRQRSYPRNRPSIRSSARSDTMWGQARLGRGARVSTCITTRRRPDGQGAPFTAGKVVAITGGARGIGKATATALRARGPGSRSAIWTSSSPSRWPTELGGEAIGLELDVTRRDSFANFLDQVSERLGPLDVLINNAGIMPIGEFAAETDATAQRMVDINLHGVIYGMKLAIPGMTTGERVTWSTSPLRRARSACPAAPPTVRPSTPSSA